MGRRKKKLLLDVLDDVLDTSRTPSGGARRSPRPVATPKPMQEREFRISGGVLAAVGVFFLVSLGVSFYLGHDRGATPASGDGSHKLRRNSSVERQGGDFAVQAMAKEYSKYSRSQLDRHMAECSALIVDELDDLRGLRESVYVLDYQDDADPERGRLVLLVGQGDRGSMVELAARLRRLVFRNEREFGGAFVVSAR